MGKILDPMAPDVKITLGKDVKCVERQHLIRSRHSLRGRGGEDFGRYTPHSPSLSAQIPLWPTGETQPRSLPAVRPEVVSWGSVEQA